MIRLYLRHGVKGDVLEARILRNALNSEKAKLKTPDCYLCGHFPCNFRTACIDIENAISFIDNYLASENGRY